MNNPHLDLSSLRNAIASLEDGLVIVNDLHWFNAQTNKV